MKVAILLLGLLSIVFGQDCQIVVPQNPLTAAGLATPFFVPPPCNQSDPMMVSFVQGSVLDTTTGKFSVYNPLAINQGSTPLSPIVTPTLPLTNVVALWFGTNAGTLTLLDNGAGSLLAGSCVNGLPGSIFGQFSYCNAVNFFAQAYAKIAAGQLVVPPLGTANDGLPCPTTRDFFVVDQDQSDNVVTSYLIVGAQAGQATTANMANFPTARVTTNGSDNRLVAVALASAMACTPFRGPDLADPMNTVGLGSLAGNEILANAFQAPPIALVPLSHAMTRVNNQPSLTKTNAYRSGVGQPMAATVANADSVQYCTNVYYNGPKRLLVNAASFINVASADPNVATNLYAFLAQRFATTFGPNGLNCASILGVAPPVVPTLNMGGLFVGAQITPPNPLATTAAGNNGGLATSTIVIIVVCTIAGVILLAGLIVGIIWYRNRSMYS